METTAVPRLSDLPGLHVPAPLSDAASARHSLVSLRRLFWLRWALLGGQALCLLACEPVIGVTLPTGALAVVFALQALFNVLTGVRLRLHTMRGTAPGEA